MGRHHGKYDMQVTADDGKITDDGVTFLTIERELFTPVSDEEEGKEFVANTQ